MSAPRLLVIPLGDIHPAAIASAVAGHFGGVPFDVLDRNELRRHPLRSLVRLTRQRYAEAVLVAPTLAAPRLRLTSFILALPRAAGRWRIDLRGQRDRFSLGHHLVANFMPIVRHGAALGIACVAGAALLRAVESILAPRRQSWPNRARTMAHGRPARILYLRPQLWLGLEGGGSVAHTGGVIGGLEQLGADVHVVSSDRLTGVSAPIHVVVPETWFDGWLREGEELTYNVAFFLGALHVARRTHPDFIYQRHTAFNLSGALLSRLLRLPFVLEFNSSELWKGRYWGGLQLVGPARLVERINLRAADRVVVVSRALSTQVQAAGVAPERVLVNPNGVDPAQFSPTVDGTAVRRRLDLAADAIVVGFSGTFGVWHGIPTLAETLARVIAARPQVRWLLIGDGPLRHMVDAAVAAHGLADRVYRPGMVPHADMPAYLAACDVLVSPHGRQADGGEFFGSPTKLFEYMASGRAIVASKVGQIADVLQHEESALLVPPEDPEALGQAIVRLVDEPCLRARLGETARLAAEAHHTWQQNAERVLASLTSGQNR